MRSVLEFDFKLVIQQIHTLTKNKATFFPNLGRDIGFLEQIVIVYGGRDFHNIAKWLNSSPYMDPTDIYISMETYSIIA